MIKYKQSFFVASCLIVLCISGSSSVYAEYNSSELQKLFTDKQQRAQIDAIRSGEYKDPEIGHTAKIKVSGYVTRSDGKSVVWLNNKNTLDTSSVGDVKVSQSDVGKNKTVTVRVDGQIKRLKPGEIWHRETDKVVESK